MVTNEKYLERRGLSVGQTVKLNPAYLMLPLVYENRMSLDTRATIISFDVPMNCMDVKIDGQDVVSTWSIDWWHPA